MLKKYYVGLLLLFFTAITIFLHIYKTTIPCLNADEVSFGYNAYSIASTGKDEYGIDMPLRFKAFGENKLPVLAYLAVPSIKLLGTTDLATRLPIYLAGIFFPLAMFALALQLFNNKNLALLTAFITALSPWIQIGTRHASEAPLSVFLVVCALTLLLKYFDSKKLSHIVAFSVLNGLSLFTYHIGKLIQPLFLGLIIFRSIVVKSRSDYDWKKIFLIFLVPVLFFAYTEYRMPTNRVGNLVFYNNLGFSLNIDQKRGEDNNRLINNKVVEGVQVVSKNYLSYFSPTFLSFTGDDNYRFWHEGMGLITPIEYIFLLIGLYFLFKDNHKQRFLLLSLLLLAPFTAALAWAGSSMTRDFLSIVPILLIVSYGMVASYSSMKKNKWRTPIFILVGFLFLFFRYTTWDFYFNHYPKRPLVIRATECGYSELSTYVRQNYGRFNKFYITKQHGQPYIHLLYNLQYSAAKYQSQANLTAPDQYGFGQVESFDKFVFNLPNALTEKNSVYIGYPDEIKGRPGYNASSDAKRLKIIKVGSEEIFYILEK